MLSGFAELKPVCFRRRQIEIRFTLEYFELAMN